MSVSNVYFVGTAILTIAATVSGGIEPALWVCGGLVCLYACCRAMSEI